MGESFHDSCGESEEGEWGEVKWTRTTRTKMRNERYGDKRATILRMPRVVDFANGADIPLAINTNVAKMVAFKAGL